MARPSPAEQSWADPACLGVSDCRCMGQPLPAPKGLLAVVNLEQERQKAMLRALSAGSGSLGGINLAAVGLAAGARKLGITAAQEAKLRCGSEALRPGHTPLPQQLSAAVATTHRHCLISGGPGRSRCRQSLALAGQHSIRPTQGSRLCRLCARLLLVPLCHSAACNCCCGCCLPLLLRLLLGFPLSCREDAARAKVDAKRFTRYQPDDLDLAAEEAAEAARLSSLLPQLQDAAQREGSGGRGRRSGRGAADDDEVRFGARALA